MAKTEPSPRGLTLLHRVRRRLRGPRAAAGVAVALPVTRDAIPFQADLEEVMEERPPVLLRGTLYAVAGLIAVLLLLCAVVKVDMIVSATGRLAADEPLIVLQPMQRSIVRTLLVKAGDVVTKGQVLATLDPTFTQADVASVSAQTRSLRAQAERLQAEVDDRPFLPSDPNSPDAILQLNLYHQRLAQYQAHLRTDEEEIRQREAGFHTIQDSSAQLGRALAVARDMETIRANLFHAQVGSRLQYLEAQSARMTTERDFQNAGNRLDEIAHDVQGRQAARQAYIDDWRRAALDELVHTRTDLAHAREELAKADRMNDLVVIAAPRDGVVLEVAGRSVGSVVREAEPIVTLLPSNAALMADIAIPSVDVGYTTALAAVSVKVDAFPYQRHGELSGTLRSVSEESFSPGSAPRQDGAAAPTLPAGGAYHRGQVMLASTHLTHLPEGARLIPGMTVTADIKVGTRSILSYFLFPLTRGLQQSFREP